MGEKTREKIRGLLNPFHRFQTRGGNWVLEGSVSIRTRTATVRTANFQMLRI